MPIYEWSLLEDSGKPVKERIIVEVLRSFSEHGVIPTPEEAASAGIPKEKVGGPWERVLGKVLVQRAPGWGSKGNW